MKICTFHAYTQKCRRVCYYFIHFFLNIQEELHTQMIFKFTHGLRGFFLFRTCLFDTGHQMRFRCGQFIIDFVWFFVFYTVAVVSVFSSFISLYLFSVFQKFRTESY